ncbi:MAG TPA: redoxin domain-containing protein [Terriglobia bacterium]|nr:redoxin domain-containing protein [Terriglobia bacterium]
MGWSLFAVALTATLVGILIWPIRPSPRDAVPGSSAPSFRLAMARGGKCDLADPLARKRVVLLSFVDARSQPLSRTQADPSRGELVFLKSMAQQYAPNGLEVLIVGCNGLLSGKPLAPGALLNFAYDWQLDGVTVLRDDDKATAIRYGIFMLPTTFLIAPDGRIQRRWEGFVASPQLALAIESVAGPPRFRR